MSSLKARLQEDIKTAMRSQDKQTLTVLRFVSAAIKQREVDERIELDDTQILQLLDKMVKQRRDSMEQFAQGGRQDLVDKEAFELALIQGYLPQPLTEEEVKKLIEEKIAEVGASSMKDMASVMAALKPLLQGRTDMAKVSQTIKTLLS